MLNSVEVSGQSKLTNSIAYLVNGPARVIEEGQWAVTAPAAYKGSQLFNILVAGADGQECTIELQVLNPPPPQAGLHTYCGFFIPEG